MTVQETESHLVLRTVYIQKNIDDKLRELAFKLGKSKNDLIREGINILLSRMENDFV